jgi:hypothetical protein
MRFFIGWRCWGIELGRGWLNGKTSLLVFQTEEGNAGREKKGRWLMKKQVFKRQTTIHGYA